MSTCWICFEKCNENDKCNCKNGFQIIHNNCIIKWFSMTGIKNCKFCNCNYKYKSSVYLYLLFKYYVISIFNKLSELLEYDLYNGCRWDDYYLNL